MRRKRLLSLLLHSLLEYSSCHGFTCSASVCGKCCHLVFITKVLVIVVCIVVH